MNIARLTQKYIREHPSVADCVDRGLINYSALAREICRVEGISAFDAVLVACRRDHARRKSRVPHEEKIAKLLLGAKIKVRNKIAVAIVEKAGAFENALGLQQMIKKQRGDFNLIMGEGMCTVITNAEYVDGIREAFGSKVRKITKNLVQISMVFDPKLETTSGVLSHIYRLFAENDINLREEMSCWTDVMVIIDEKDVGKALQVLNTV